MWVHCDNCVACNAIIARAQYIANDIRFEMSSIQFWKQLKQMQISFSNNIINIWSIHVIFAVIKCVWWVLQRDVITLLSYAEVLWCSNCTIALHQKNVLKFVKRRFENLNLLFLWKFEFSIDSNKLESLIVVYSLIESFIDFSIDHS